MSGPLDTYPTRKDNVVEKFERLEPVVHTSGKARLDGPLTKGQVDFFEWNGFVSFENFFAEDEMVGFFDDLDQYNRDAALKEREQVFTEPESDEIRSIYGIHQISERFNRMTRDPRLLDMAQQLIGNDVYIHQSRINVKPAFKGSGFNWHSDFETWHSEDGMPKMRAVSFSITLTENNEFNGPLMLIPGSHRYFIPCRGKTPDDNWKESLKLQKLGVPPTEDLRSMTNLGGLVAPKGPAGSLIIFECNTLHASSNNLSPYPRNNLFFVYNSVDNALREPYCGNSPRPEFVATRENMSGIS